MSPSKQQTGLTAEEKAAMKATLKERKLNETGEKAIQGALAEMTPADRALGKRVHELVTKAAPDLTPKTWYGMPAYANKDGKVVVFFRNAGKFKERYSMLGFNEAANLDDGAFWPVAYAVPELKKSDESKIKALVKQAAS